MRHKLRVYDAVWHASDVLLSWHCLAGYELVGLYSRPVIEQAVLRVYQHRDGTSQRRRRCILLLMLVRPSARLAYKHCLRTPQREDAAPKSPEARRQFTRTEPSPADVRETVRRRAWVTGARGTNAKRVRCADAPTRQLASNPVRRRARLAETAIAREAAARRRRGGPGSLSLSVFLSPLSVDRRRGAPSSSSKRSARVQLCWHIS
jgi:hypothetical protein